MESLIEILEQELEEAVEVKNRKSLHRYTVLLTQSLVQVSDSERDSRLVREEIAGTRSDVQELAAVMREGFAGIDKRFEDMNRRFDDVNRRFEDANHRFEDVNRRFDDVNKRFDDVNKRFEDLGKRISANTTFVTIALSILIAVTVLFRFV